jgi:hypothetical protein
MRKIALSFFSRLPPRLREKLKKVIGAGGHSSSVVNGWRAAQLWDDWKRPDRLVPALRDILDAVDLKSLDGCIVMDYGSGFLLADAFIYSMFGAKEVSAVDYERLLQSKFARSYVMRFNWAPYLEIAAKMRGREPVENWSARLSEALLDERDDWYRHLGIRYVAPFDITADRPPCDFYDLIVSRSTLEHVPPDLATTIVGRLGKFVRKGGSMYHYIHLADHRDIKGDPLAFLGADNDYEESQFDLRGNRMRVSDWRLVFAELTDYSWNESVLFDNDAKLPDNISNKFSGYDSRDLAATHFSIWGKVEDGRRHSIVGCASD